MRNKELFSNKLGRIDGKLKSIRVLTTRPNQTQEVHRLLNEIEEQLEDLNNMIEREQ